MAGIDSSAKERIKKAGELTLSYQDGTGSLNLSDLGLILDIANLEEALPEQKRSSVSIPGRNGSLDMTYALTDAPVFENRSLKYVFKAYAGRSDLSEIREKLINSFHGREVHAVCSWNNGRYFAGNCQMELKQSASSLEVTVKIDADPFLYDSEETEASFAVSGSSTVTLSNGTKWLTPEVTCDSAFSVTVNGTKTAVSAGDWEKHDGIYLKSGDSSATLEGTGTIKFRYRKGRL